MQKYEKKRVFIPKIEANSSNILKVNVSKFLGPFSVWKFLAICVTLIMFIVILTMSINQFYAFGNIHPRDMASAAQPVHQTLFAHKFMFENQDWHGNFLGIHFSIVAFLLMPFYLFFPSIPTLLVLQTIVNFLAVIFVWLIGKYWFQSEKISFFLVVAYLFYHPFLWNMLNDFRVANFMIPFLIATFYFYLRRQLVPFIISAFLFCYSREEGMIALMGFALVEAFLWIAKKFKFSRFTTIKTFDYRFLLSPVLIAVSYFVIAVLIVQPAILKQFPYVEQKSYIVMTFNFMGNSVLEIIKNSLLHPFKIIGMCFNDIRKIEFLIQCILPFAFIMILGPEFYLLSILPFIVYFIQPFPPNDSISTNYSLTNAGIRHTDILLGMYFIGAIIGLKKIQELTINKTKIFIISLILIISTVVITNVIYSPVPWSKKYDDIKYRFIITDRDKKMDLIAEKIPHSAKISTIFDYLAFFSDRYYLHNINQFERLDDKNKLLEIGDYVLVDFRRRWALGMDGFFYNMWRIKNSDEKYVCVYLDDMIFLWIKSKIFAFSQFSNMPTVPDDKIWPLIFGPNIGFTEQYAFMSPLFKYNVPVKQNYKNIFKIYQSNLNKKANHNCEIKLYMAKSDKYDDDIKFIFNFVGLNGTPSFSKIISPVIPVFYWEKNVVYEAVSELTGNLGSYKVFFILGKYDNNQIVPNFFE